MSTLPKTFLTPEQYLEIERKAEYKSEYYKGEMFAMSGARWNHNSISSNLHFKIREQLDPNCRVVGSDQRVFVPATGLYTYPDLVVCCGEPRFQDAHFDTLLNPILIVEVLSPSTEDYDRGRKFRHYRTIESLDTFLLVASQSVSAELWVREPDRQWKSRPDATRLEDIIEIESPGCRLELADIYAGVQFEQL